MNSSLHRKFQVQKKPVEGIRALDVGFRDALDSQMENKGVMSKLRTWLPFSVRSNRRRQESVADEDWSLDPNDVPDNGQSSVKQTN